MPDNGQEPAICPPPANWPRRRPWSHGAVPGSVPGAPGSSWARADTASWIVAAEDPQVLTLVLGVARELTILAAASTGADPTVDVSRARTALGHLLDLLTRVEDVNKHVSTADKALINIRGTAEGLRAAGWS
jgi:hypothetical protein